MNSYIIMITTIMAGIFTLLSAFISAGISAGSAFIICRVKKQQTNEKFRREVLAVYREFTKFVYSFAFRTQYEDEQKIITPAGNAPPKHTKKKRPDPFRKGRLIRVI